MPSSGTLRHVTLVRTDISEERIASIGGTYRLHHPLSVLIIDKYTATEYTSSVCDGRPSIKKVPETYVIAYGTMFDTSDTKLSRAGSVT
jgi:hypothetical protein